MSSRRCSSPVSTARRNASTVRRASAAEAAPRGRRAATWARARWAIWRTAVWLLPTASATWAEVREHYDDDQVGALVCLVSLINAATRMNVIVHNPGGGYEPGMFAGMSS